MALGLWRKRTTGRLFTLQAALQYSKTLLASPFFFASRFIIALVLKPISMNYVRLLCSALLLIGAIAYVIDQTDWPPLLTAFSSLSWGLIVSATLAMAAGALLASLRLQWIAHDLGYRLSFRDSISALSLGQVMGLLFFQLAGQLLARGAVMSRRQIPASATIVITGYERFAALAVSLSLALAATIYLFGTISIDFSTGGTTFVKLVIGMFLATASGAAFAWGHLIRANLPAPDRRGLKKLARIVAISLAIQLTTMGAYILLAHALAPTVAIASLAAGSALVMLAASLPISFAGWGIREMSAIFVLAAIGVPAEASLTVAVLVGILGFAVVGTMAFTAIGHDKRSPAAAPHKHAKPVDFGALLDQVLPVAAASAVFFQVILPLTNNAISVNMADPVAILGGSLFVLHHFGRHWPHWRLSSFNIWVGVASTVLVAGYLHGLARLGWSDWAFANRLLGWPLLLCYGATGALIVHRLGRQGLDLLLRTFAVVAATVVALEIVLVIAAESGATFLQSMAFFPLNGFSQSRNGFAFLLLMAVGVLLATRWRRQYLWLGIVLAGVIMAGSRAGFIGVGIVIAVALFVSPRLWRQLAAACAVATAIIAATFLIPATVHVPLGPGGGSIVADLALQVASTESSDTERFKSLIGGWQLFSSYPLFGAGLGAFMEQQIALGKALVIHSTPLWLLAEFGIVGFAAMVAPVVLIFRAEALRLKDQDVAGRLLILIVSGFAVMSLAHELMFQRAFWLLLGAALAVLPAALPAPTAATTPKTN